MSKTVNFIDAVNSGKRFRVVENSMYREDIYYEVTANGHIVYSSDKESIEGLASYKGFITSKCIIEEKEITITESQLDDAFSKIGISYSSKNKVKQELGF